MRRATLTVRNDTAGTLLLDPLSCDANCPYGTAAPAGSPPGPPVPADLWRGSVTVHADWTVPD